MPTNRKTSTTKALTLLTVWLTACAAPSMDGNAAQGSKSTATFQKMGHLLPSFSNVYCEDDSRGRFFELCKEELPEGETLHYEYGGNPILESEITKEKCEEAVTEKKQIECGYYD